MKLDLCKSNFIFHLMMDLASFSGLRVPCLLIFLHAHI